MKTIGVTQFKAHALTYFQEVADTGREILITKRGKPLARVVPSATMPRPRKIQLGAHAHAVQIVGDIVSPVMNPEDWSALRGELEPRRRRRS